ncbi:MAG: caspase family protein [Spirochaetales bacterium]|nr:caspase family protein [Spirochaetales bacterium]
MMSKTMKNIFIQVGVIAFITLLFLFSAVNVSAQESVMRRYALYVGSNYGGRDRVTLSYAVTDARAISEVMQQLGGVMPLDGIILTDPSPALVDDTVRAIRRQIEADSGGKRSEFFFYYSGHSDEKGLLLGEHIYRYEDLKKAIDSVEADVNIAILDSCSSGAFTRMKGGVRRSPFLSDTSVKASGHAFLTSSSEDEAAQESDDLGASFFTHYLVTALRGAADSALDGTVSLNEAYSYASSETLARTEDTMAGPQHPSYDIQLAGTGDLILTDLRAVSEQVMFEEGLRGRIFVRDGAGRLIVELKKVEGTALAVSIGPGRYSMILDDGDQLLSADLMLTGGSKILIVRDEFYPVPKSSTTSRGGAIVKLPDTVSAEEDKDDQTDTIAELDEIARRAERRALAAAGAVKAENDENGSWKAPKKDEVRAEETGWDEGLSFGIVANARNFDGFQIGIIGSEVSGDLDGFQVGSVFATADGTVDGLQLAGIYCNSDGDVNGLQLSGIWNNGENVAFLQGSGIFNTAGGDLTGVQYTGIFNTVGGDVLGGQAAGIFNLAEGDVLGIQLAGIFNVAADVTGIQAAGIVNTAESVSGIQAGLLNFGGKVYGLQVGLVNISDELYGVPIGLVNISGNGLHDFSVWNDDNNFLNFGYQLGTPVVYTFASFGVTNDNFDNAATAGIGMGFELAIESFFVDLDLYAKSYQGGQGSLTGNVQGIFTGKADYYPALRLSGGVELFGFLSLFGGVNLDCRLIGSYSDFSYDIGSTAAASYDSAPVVVDFDANTTMEMYPSWFLGIRL